METSLPPDWKKQFATLQQDIANQQRTLQKLESRLAHLQAQPAPLDPLGPKTFCDWLKIGFAVTLPILVLGSILLIILLAWSLKYTPHVSPP